MWKTIVQTIVLIAIFILVVAYYSLGAYYGSTVLAFVGISFDDTKTVVEVLRSVVETIALIIAGVWTYNRFIKAREDFPYPKIEHRIEDYKLAKGIGYLSVTITVVNEGKTKLDLGRGKIYVRQVLPITDSVKKLVEKNLNETGVNPIIYGKAPNLFKDLGQRVGWETLGSRDWKEQLRDEFKELEPSQTRETQFDFLLVRNEGEEDVEVVQIISYFNFGKSHWELATLHSLAQSQVHEKSD